MPSRSALTITWGQPTAWIMASGPGRRWESRMAMCASTGLNMQTTNFGLCCPSCDTARVAAGRACMMGHACRSGTTVVWKVSPCHAARRCSSWSGFHTNLGGLAHPGYCRLLGVLMMCSKTASG